MTTTKEAIRWHGSETNEAPIGTEDRLVQYADGAWGWQARGTDNVHIFDTRDEAEADYAAADQD